MYVRRVAKTTDRVTHAHVYKISSNGVIIDDNRQIMTPYLNNDRYWARCDRQGYGIPPETKPYKPGDKIAPHILTKKETTMLEIEINTTIINGKSATKYSTDELIQIIKQEEDKLEALTKITVFSKAINALRIKHTMNVKAIVEAMDKQFKG